MSADHLQARAFLILTTLSNSATRLPDPPLPGREGLRVGPAKALGGFQQNRLRYPFRVFPNVTVPEPNYGPTLTFQPAGPDCIFLGLYMLAAIHVDGKLRLTAGKIGDEVPDNELPRKGRSILRQQPPQGSFLTGRARSERTGAAGHFRIDTAHTSHPAARRFGLTHP